MRDLSLVQKLCLLQVVLLLVALLPLPYGYYAFLRLVVAVFMGYMAYKFYNDNKKGLMVVAILIALLFQPFSKIPLERELWMFIDAVLAVMLFIYVISDKKADN